MHDAVYATHMQQEIKLQAIEMMFSWHVENKSVGVHIYRHTTTTSHFGKTKTTEASQTALSAGRQQAPIKVYQGMN